LTPAVLVISALQLLAAAAQWALCNALLELGAFASDELLLDIAARDDEEVRTVLLILLLLLLLVLLLILVLVLVLALALLLTLLLPVHSCARCAPRATRRPPRKYTSSPPPPLR